MDHQEELDFIRRSAARIEELERAPRTFDDPYSDMTTHEKSLLLIEQQKRIDRLEKALAAEAEGKERVLSRNTDLESMVAKLLASLEAKDRLLNEMSQKLDRIAANQPDPDKPSPREKELLRIIADLQAELRNRNRQTYDSKSQKRSSKSKGAEPAPKDRQQDKDEHDGTPGASSPDDTMDPVGDGSNAPKRPHTPAEEASFILRKGSSYKKMGADRTITHPFDRSRLPEGAVVISVFKRYAYEQTVSLVEHEYELVKYKLGDKFFTEYLPAQDDSHQVVDRVKGTKASADFMAHLAFNRFVLDTPLYREHMRLDDEGFRRCRKTLTNWLHKGSLLLTPMVDWLKKNALQKDAIINCDEIWCRVRINGRFRKRYIWCLVNRKAKIAIYCYEDGSRSRKALKSILDGAELKALQTDGYNVYLYLDDEMIDIDHVCCMAHARAKFGYASQIAGDTDADYILDCIAELYRLEAEYDRLGLSDEERTLARKSPQTIEIVGRLRSKIDALLADGHPPRGELMEKAIRYIDNYWNQIFLYLSDGRYSIDNNVAERHIRPLAGERKNSLFFGSHKMAKASAAFHTAISTCRMAGLSVLDYFKTFFRKVVIEGETDYGKLLPHTIGLHAKNY